MRLRLLILALVLLAPCRGFGSDTEFDSIVSGVGQESHDQLCAAMEGWLQRHPDSPDTIRGLLWMSRLWELDQRPDLARSLLERAVERGKGTAWELPAAKELADLDAWEHRYTVAIEAYDRLAVTSDPVWSQMGKNAAIATRNLRAQFYVLCALLAVLVGLAGIRIALTLRAGLKPWRAPLEALIAAPFAALLIAGAFTQDKAEMRAVIELALGGLALMWVAGASLRGRTVSGWRRLGEIALGVAQTAALVYCCLAANGLWTKFIDTMVMGISD